MIAGHLSEQGTGVYFGASWSRQNHNRGRIPAYSLILRGLSPRTNAAAHPDVSDRFGSRAMSCRRVV